MKSTLSYSASLLLAAGLSSALPTSNGQNRAIITISTGDGDSATTLQAGIGAVTTTSGFNAKSVKSTVFQDKVWCGGFKDAGATNLWLNFDGTDGIFSTGVDARYSSVSDGGVASKREDTVTVASYWCADSLAGVQNRIQQRTLPPREAQNGAAPPPPANNGADAPAVGNGQTARLTLELEPQTTFIQREIPIDGQLTALDTTVVSFSFVQVIAGVSCQAFNGQTPVGNAASGNTPAVLGAQPVQITAIQCSNGQGAAAPAPAPVNNGAAAPSGVTTNIQVETERQTTFFGEEIQVNGQPQQIRQGAAFSLTLTSVDGAEVNQVRCVVLKNGQVLSALTGLDPAILTNGREPVSFDAVQCDI